MSEPARALPPGFEGLSIDERIEYIQSLWDQVSADPTGVPIPEWHQEVLHQRIRDQRDNPDTGEPWSTVRERLERKLDDDTK